MTEKKEFCCRESGYSLENCRKQYRKLQEFCYEAVDN